MSIATLINALTALIIGLAIEQPAFAQSSPGNPSSRSEAPAKQALPEGPLLKPAPEFSRWSVDFLYPQDRKDAKKGPSVPLNPELTRKTLTTKTKDLIHEEILTVGGKKIDDWQVNGNFYIKDPVRNMWSAYEKDSQSTAGGITDLARLAIPNNGFRGLDWISKESYVGSLKSKDVLYLVFVPPGSPNVDIADVKTLQGQPTIAYIDATSRLPFSVTENNVTRTYTFTANPPTSQAVPSDLATEIKVGDEIRAKRNAVPMKEY